MGGPLPEILPGGGGPAGKEIAGPTGNRPIMSPLLLTAYLLVAGLPAGHGPVTFGMTVDQLRSKVQVDKVNTTEGFNYAEHLEEDPEVYAGMGDQHERIEYYFFEGRLYKIFIIYDRMFYHTGLYKRLVADAQKRFGKPEKVFDESLMDLLIHHTLWEDADTSLDLRMGAGFIYQVRTDKAMADKKAKAQKKHKGI
jgi:hypothetical protein